MNVIVANEKSNQLASLNVDIIKSVTGVFDALEIVEMFRSFFYNKLILDVTALRGQEDIRSYEVIAQGLDVDKVIFLMPEGSKLCTASFLSRLISLGIYNFTSNINGVSYLIKKTNTLKDVEHIVSAVNIQRSTEAGAAVTTIGSAPSSPQPAPIHRDECTVIGFRNVTLSAGASTLIYMLKKELALTYGQDNIGALEVNKNDFILFNEKNMHSCRSEDLNTNLERLSSLSILLVDLNDCMDDSFCKEVVYLVEPSTFKLNRLLRRNSTVFSKLTDKKIVLNQSMLLNNDVFDFEREAGVRVFYNIPPLDERKRNGVISDFLDKLGLFSNNIHNSTGNNKIFGLFRR